MAVKYSGYASRVGSTRAKALDAIDKQLLKVAREQISPYYPDLRVRVFEALRSAYKAGQESPKQ